VWEQQPEKTSRPTEFNGKKKEAKQQMVEKGQAVQLSASKKAL